MWPLLALRTSGRRPPERQRQGASDETSEIDLCRSSRTNGRSAGHYLLVFLPFQRNYEKQRYFHRRAIGCHERVTAQHYMLPSNRAVLGWPRLKPTKVSRRATPLPGHWIVP